MKNDLSFDGGIEKHGNSLYFDHIFHSIYSFFKKIYIVFSFVKIVDG
jgi:hypothetical protein